MAAADRVWHCFPDIRSLLCGASFRLHFFLPNFFDLDRCYSISRIPVENGKELVIFELHMSAYGNSDAIREGQIRMLCNDMGGRIRGWKLRPLRR